MTEPSSSAEIDQLSEHRLLRVQAPFLGHVPEEAAIRRGGRFAVPAHLTAIDRQHTHDHSHAGGLACTVRTDEPRDRPVGDEEPHMVDGDLVTKTANYVVEL